MPSWRSVRGSGARKYGTRKRYGAARVGQSARIRGLIAKFGKKRRAMPSFSSRKGALRRKPGTMYIGKSAAFGNGKSQASIRVAHREFLTKVYSNAATVGGVATKRWGGPSTAPVNQGAASYSNSIQSFRLNPGWGVNPAGAASEGWIADFTVGGTNYGKPAGNVTPAYTDNVVGVVDGLPYGNQLACFPWLSNIALQYEQYKIHNLCIEYVPTAVESTANGANAMGSLDMYLEYNVTQGIQQPPTSQTNFLNNMYAQSTKVTKPCKMHLQHGQQTTAHPILYNSKNALAYAMPTYNSVAGTGYVGTVDFGDARLYDPAILYICCFGQQADRIEMGQLYITYDIELIKPQLAVR